MTDEDIDGMTAAEMFDLLIELELINEDSVFDDWMHERSDMGQMLKDYNDNYGI